MADDSQPPHQGPPGVSAERPRVERTPSRLDRPVFIVAAPGSGASELGEALSRAPDVWTAEGGGDLVVEGHPELHPANRGWDSDRLTARDASPRVSDHLEAGMVSALRDREGNGAGQATGLRLVESAPKNSLRVPFLGACYPDALFVLVLREPEQSLRSAMAAWESGRFVIHPDLPEWSGPAWSVVLTPEWRKLAGSELPEIVAEQWRMASEILLRDMAKLAPERWTVVSHERLLTDPHGELERLREFAGLETGHDAVLRPPVRVEADEQYAAAAAAVLPRVSEVAQRGSDLLAGMFAAGDGAGEKQSPYRSVSSGNIAQLLAQLGSSLLVSTYQTGKLVAVREADGGLNTHFRALESPMGIAHHEGRLAVGTKSQVWEYRNLPALTEKLQPPGRHDACFVPRTVSYTGDIRVHDVAWAGGELWLVATRFSCLATLDGAHSFVPRWRPPFITGLAAEDRCHLNGMAVIDDEVRYVTALGETDTPGGWRENKASGGVLIDVESGETVISGLSMPHSPRWHRDRLWILESGQGTLATVDLDAGTVETVAELPGFTRGLAFAGPLAFIGLSEVREATTFGGLPLTARLEERQCGVWVVNIETGETVGFLRFEDLVQEIFDVALLPGIRFPEIAEHGSEAVNSSFVVPDEALAGSGEPAQS